MVAPKKTILNAQGYEPPLFIENYKLKLDLNENILGPSPKVIEAIRQTGENDIKFYPTYGELIEKLAESNNIDKLCILPTNGADESFSYIFSTFIENNDTVLTVSPCFAMPKVYATSTGCDYKLIKYKEKWVFPINELIENIDSKTRMIILTTPNSPTGDAISRTDLVKVLDNSQNSIVLLDETYSSFAEERFSDLISSYENLIIIRSMSKDFALAGLRLGYIMANSHIIEYIKRIISPYSVNIIAARAAIAALDDKEYFESVKNQIKESKEILYDGLKNIAVKLYKSESNFILADFGQKAEFYYRKLLNSGIKVKYYKNDPDLDGCFRITVPSPEQAKDLIDALQSREMIVFDMDGVLVDTRNSYRLAIKGTYEYFSSKEISFEEIQQAKNLGGLNNDWDLTEFLLKESDIEIPKDQIISKFQELYYSDNADGFILNETLLIEPDKLRALSSKYDLAIFTGRPKAEAEFVLKRWGLENLFYPVITMDDVPDDRHKPDPYGIIHIMSITDSENIYYLGDTPDDMMAAKAANVSGIGILPPQDKTDTLKDRLLSEGAMVVLEQTYDLPDFLGAKTYANK